MRLEIATEIRDKQQDLMWSYKMTLIKYHFLVFVAIQRIPQLVVVDCMRDRILSALKLAVDDDMLCLDVLRQPTYELYNIIE